MNNFQMTGVDVGGNNLKTCKIEYDPKTNDIMVLEASSLPIFEFELFCSQLLLEFDHKIPITITETISSNQTIFKNQQEGSLQIAKVFNEIYRKNALFSTLNGITNYRAVNSNPKIFSCRNWFATSKLFQKLKGIENGLFIDMGSTSVDVVPIINQKSIHYANVDGMLSSRLGTGELIWSGLLHTPLISFLRKLNFEDKSYRLNLNCRATTMDMNLILGNIEANSIQDKFSLGDNDYKTFAEDPNMESSLSMIRNLICADNEILSDKDCFKIAEKIETAQKEYISLGINQVMNKMLNSNNKIDTIILAGSAKNAILGSIMKEIKLNLDFELLITTSDEVLHENNLEILNNLESALACAYFGIQKSVPI